MNGLSLFTGIGGLEIALERILPTRPIFYIEREIPSVSILQRNMLNGLLQPAPIYSNVETFKSIAHHFAESVDFISAGFPCQPHSSAGKRRSTDDDRWLWPHISDLIRICSPSFIFLENVSNLLNQPDATSEIFTTLSQKGYDAQWTTLKASSVGANHHRNRLFIFAYLPSQLPRIKHHLHHPNHNSSHTNSEGYGLCSSQPEENCDRQHQAFKEQRNLPLQLCPSHPTHPNHFRWRAFIQNLRKRQPHSSRCLDPFSSRWWTTPPAESPLRRMDNGIPSQLHRLRSLGNAVCPIQAAYAFWHLIEEAP